MRSKSTVIEGPAFRVIVEEVNETDRAGGVLMYVASLYLQVRGSTKLHLIRRSRVPGSAADLVRDARLGRVDVGVLIAPAA
ncbi:hypothetical protein [Rhizobium leguminosarum]|uniref:hypothetical protein n=1 Tax=Rhizobium leguminosarum TaxID=384 RepID=UPI00102FDFA7|nr:hypothetical protein [Rhizobium leguminosarum]TAU85851.1 hypothetical protein ELI40_22435 [Rhizobium leguminosarum]